MENDQGKVVDLYVPRKWYSFCPHFPFQFARFNIHPSILEFFVWYIVADSWSSAATGRLITAKDHASVQINIGHVDENGHIITGQHTTYAICGFVRTRSESDDCINRLATADGLLEGYRSLTFILVGTNLNLVSGVLRDEKGGRVFGIRT